MIQTVLKTSLFVAAFALAACNEAPAPEIEAPAEEPAPVVHTPDPGKIALETAPDFDAYQQAVRDSEARMCTWTEKNGKPVPIFYRATTLQAFFEDLETLAAEDESAVEARLDEINSEFDTCVELKVPRMDQGAPVPAPDFSDQLILRLNSRYVGMAENAFRLADRFAHPISYVCPVQTETGSGVFIAYDKTLKTLWSDDITASISSHLDDIFPDTGSPDRVWSIAPATSQDMLDCRDAFLAMSQE